MVAFKSLCADNLSGHQFPRDVRANPRKKTWSNTTLTVYSIYLSINHEYRPLSALSSERNTFGNNISNIYVRRRYQIDSLNRSVIDHLMVSERRVTHCPRGNFPTACSYTLNARWPLSVRYSVLYYVVVAHQSWTNAADCTRAGSPLVVVYNANPTTHKTRRLNEYKYK